MAATTTPSPAFRSVARWWQSTCPPLLALGAQRQQLPFTNVDLQIWRKTFSYLSSYLSDKERGDREQESSVFRKAFRLL